MDTIWLRNDWKHLACQIWKIRIYPWVLSLIWSFLWFQMKVLRYMNVVNGLIACSWLETKFWSQNEWFKVVKIKGMLDWNSGGVTEDFSPLLRLDLVIWWLEMVVLMLRHVVWWIGRVFMAINKFLEVKMDELWCLNKRKSGCDFAKEKPKVQLQFLDLI